MKPAPILLGDEDREVLLAAIDALLERPRADEAKALFLSEVLADNRQRTHAATLAVRLRCAGLGDPL